MNIAGLPARRIEAVDKEVIKELNGEECPLDSRAVGVEEAMKILALYYSYCNMEISFTDIHTMVVGGHSISIKSLALLGLWDEKPALHRYSILHSLTSLVDTELERLGVVLPSFRWRPHQIGEGLRLWELVKVEGWAMLMHLPRTGKTGTVLYAMECCDVALSICIVTTKNARAGLDGKGGWLGFIELAKASGWLQRHTYCVTTPHQLHKEKAGVWDIVVMDESHKIYSDPKPSCSQLWLLAKQLIGDARVIFVTATPHAQSINQLYWQLGLCNYTPFIRDGLDSFDKYFNKYGKPYTVIIGNGVAIPRYDKGDVSRVYADVGYGFMVLSQLDVGFNSELLPVDVKVYVELSKPCKDVMKAYEKDEVMKVGDCMIHSLNSSDIPLRLHQLEGSTLKYVDVWSITDEATGIRRRDVKPMVYNWELPWLEKVNYILERWGDSEDLAIMYHYVNEGKMLRRHFKKAKIMQGKTHSEGLDLWHYKTLVVYSMDYSVATYIQRRDRQVHLTNRVEPIEVYYLLVKGGISEAIYESVVEKGEDLTFSAYSGKLQLG